MAYDDEREKRRQQEKDDLLRGAGTQGLQRDAAAGLAGGAVNLEHLFKYHPPTLDQLTHYGAIRMAAKYFAEVILLHTPPGPDQVAAIRKIREAMMTANAAIATNGFGG